MKDTNVSLVREPKCRHKKCQQDFTTASYTRAIHTCAAGHLYCSTCFTPHSTCFTGAKCRMRKTQLKANDLQSHWDCLLQHDKLANWKCPMEGCKFQHRDESMVIQHIKQHTVDEVKAAGMLLMVRSAGMLARPYRTQGKGEHQPPDVVITEAHEPLYEFLQRLGFKANVVKENRLRLGTWNVKHFGAETRTPPTGPGDLEGALLERRKHARENKEAHDNERARNLVEVIHQSRCVAVALQEISGKADLPGLCKLLDDRVAAAHVGGRGVVGDGLEGTGHGGGVQHTKRGWCCTEIVGEHALLYHGKPLASFLGCSADELKVEVSLYDHTAEFADQSKKKQMSISFAVATNWTGITGRFELRTARCKRRAPARALFCAQREGTGQPRIQVRRGVFRASGLWTRRHVGNPLSAAPKSCLAHAWPRLRSFKVPLCTVGRLQLNRLGRGEGFGLRHV